MINHFVIDVEANGPIIGKHSMIQIGIVNVHDTSINFYGELKPLSNEFDQGAMTAIGLEHKDTLAYPSAPDTMKKLNTWLDGFDFRPIMWSDNPGFDWGWLNWYMWTYLGNNRLGWSCRRIGDLDSGMTGNLRSHRWRKYKVTKHTHNALDDAMGNAEALKVLFQKLIL